MMEITLDLDAPSGYKLKYRIAVMYYDGIHYLYNVVTDSGVNSIVNNKSFVRWVHNDWQEVDV